MRPAILSALAAGVCLLAARSGPGAGQWRLSPYPDGHRFAFTLVHDADSAYSRRLAPLFEEFDRLHFRITATVFVFWAQWANPRRTMANWLSGATPEQAFQRPVSVPLEEPRERAFYLALAARGYEIGMHSPSETSDTTEKMEAAFAFFRTVFGHPPAVYVEHSAPGNREALGHDGADPHSPYYSLGVLRKYQPWIWVDDAQAFPRIDGQYPFDLDRIPGAPFRPALERRYGLSKVFLRSGIPGAADGDGFLKLYSEDHIDSLVRDRGLALVYTHLDDKWLDPATRRMREPLRRRLEYLAARNPWAAPAGTILDRLSLMSRVDLRFRSGRLRIENRSPRALEGITVIAPSKSAALCRGHLELRPDASGDIVIGPLAPSETVEFTVCR